MNHPAVIPLSQPDITDRERAAVLEVLSGTQLSLGPKLPEFERAICQATGARYAVAVNSGTSALHLCVKAVGIGAGDQVITTPFSFVASANCALYENAEPVFVDIDPATWNIDVAKIEAAVSPRTRSIVPVHVFGRPANMHAIMDIARRNRLSVIEDACEALGAAIGGKAAGTFGDAGAFAFYPNKQITTGEGGAIVTDDASIAALCRSMRNQGRSDEGEGSQHERLGFNYRLSNIHCALGIAQLARFDEIRAARTAVAERYEEMLSGFEEIILPPLPEPGVEISWFVFVIRLSDDFTPQQRDAVLSVLREHGMGCSNYFMPVHLQPFYRERFGYSEGDFPVTERVADRTIALPFFNRLTAEQASAVVKTLRAALDAVERSSMRSRIVVAPPSPHGFPLRHSALDGLFARPPVRVDEQRLRDAVKGKTFLVTGAAGSIGLELCLQIAGLAPGRLIVLDQCESALFDADLELRRRFSNVDVMPKIGDIRNYRSIEETIRAGRVDTIVHAAGYKHVPLMERHICEAVETNTIGTWNIAQAASRNGVRQCLLISSDKAVKPASVMGATKRAAELIFAAMHNAPANHTNFSSVRFGNVLGSSGSVVPIFKKQIAAGGPLTVTHPDVQRYFISVGEAAALILQASTLAQGSEIFVFEMGEPVKIVDLARYMICQAGFVPDNEIAIRYTGLRPGEKLFEELVAEGEFAIETAHEKIRAIAAPNVEYDTMKIWIEEARGLIQHLDREGVANHLGRMVPNYGEAARRDFPAVHEITTA